MPVIATAVCGYADHVEQADAGFICSAPFEQQELNRLLARMLEGDREQWRRSAEAYARREDLYTLTERAADAIIERARRNRSAHRPVAASA